MVEAAPARGWTAHAVTIDHGLRKESADEARYVGSVCAALGVSHDVIAWNDSGSATGNLSERARRARYSLIADWALGRGVGHVVVGHTADDQAETFLMGLSRKAGVDGLSGMRAAWNERGVVFVRPLLDVLRADLRSYLTRKKVDWVDDPTNENEHYLRVKARKALIALQPLGISVEHLAAVVEHLDFARSALSGATTAVAAKVTQERSGALHVDLSAFQNLQFELQRRLLNGVVRWMSGEYYAPRAEAIEQLQGAILRGQASTLGGCRMRVTATEIGFTREPRAVASLTASTHRPWDKRWHLSGPHAPDLQVRALGTEGLRQAKDWRATGLSRDTLSVTPGVWRGETLIAAPCAGFGADWTASVSPSFVSFLLSH
jgi:tRNA(Ile)-lysidine synthase